MDVIDLSTMSIRDIEDRIKHYENDEEFYTEMMLNVFEKTQPKGVQPKYDIVQGSPLRQDKFLCYTIECEEPLYKAYEEKRDEAHDMVVALTDYVDNEIKRIGEYNYIVAEIVKLRDIDGLRWYKIAERVHYSPSHTRKLYKEAKNQRFIET